MNPKVFLPSAAIGGAIMLFGVWGLFHDAAMTRPADFTKWFVGALIVHDFLLAPATLVVGHLLRRRLGERVRASVQVGLILTSVLFAASFPVLFAFGRRAINPTVLPPGAVPGFLLGLAILWTIVAVFALGTKRGT